MKKFLTAIAALIFVTSVFAQKKDTTSVNNAPVAQPKKKDWSKIDLSHRANDHFMVQIGYDNWNGTPDTLSISGFSRSFNFYFMLDFPFKSDPRLSVGAGLGIGNSNIFFKNQPASPISVLPRADASGGNHFKKYKLVTTYLEIPVELRFALDPENTNKSWKFAVGTKVGTMLSAYAKGKNVENGSGQTIDASIYKVSNKSNFNSIKLAATARISKGPFGIFGQYQLTSLIKSIDGPIVYPFSFGICFSGL
jgi:outer membrane protein with beta-barrel domain